MAGHGSWSRSVTLDGSGLPAPAGDPAACAPAVPAHPVAARGPVRRRALLMLGPGPRGAVGCVAEVPLAAWHDPAAGLEADDGVAHDLAGVYLRFPGGAEPGVFWPVAALGGGAAPADTRSHGHLLQSGSQAGAQLSVANIARSCRSCRSWTGRYASIQQRPQPVHAPL